MAQQIQYKLKCLNEDFRVKEVSLSPKLESKGSSQYTYVLFEKSGLTTFDLMEQILDFFNLTFEDIGSQGLKDEDAVTEQLISIKKILSSRDISAFNKKHASKKEFSRMKHLIGYGNEPVKERLLHGNSFSIVVRNLKKNVATDLLNYISSDRHHYFINYYDSQRFGMPDGPYNTHLIGKAIVKNKWKEAMRHLQNSRNGSPDIAETPKKNDDFKKIFQRVNPKRVQFYISSYNSYLWNSTTSALIKKHVKSSRHNFENVGMLHVPNSNAFQCPHTCEIGGHEFSHETFSVSGKPYKRNILVLTTIYAGSIEDDDLHRNKKKLCLSFFLPTGSYATMIVKQVFLRIQNEKQ